jgi:amino acid transporter
MSRQKKFGAFDGVFTPSILTILGVIMYMRMGWVVGNGGLWGSIIIVVIAHVISFSTGLSISSISTDKKVGAGGVYYVLSRSLGLPIGGAIGLTLFVGTALSIALYLVGFAESFNSFLGLSTDINGMRSTGSLFLFLLTVLAFISTSVAIKTQFFILAAILASLVVIFMGGSPAEAAIPETLVSETVPMETVFAIFFPAVTGFTAGIAMSGDLADPKRDIPMGTIASIVVGFVVYIALTIFLYSNVDLEVLRSDYNILQKISIWGPAVIAGIWGATLSSAIGGILGAPRILQAMSLDRITPRLFAKGVGAANEPRNALILTVLIAEGGILIGELDLIARIVSMFYLAAYGFINIAFFLESWASSDFKPSFRVSKWIGLVGFMATFAVMFKLDMLAMVAALVVIGGVFLWLQRKQVSLGTGDVWQSVWSTVVKSGLKRMEVNEDHKRNWKPNIMLFSGNSEQRPYLIEFGKNLAGQVGMITNFDLVENRQSKVLFPKHKQKVNDDLLQKYGIFGRRIEVSNVYKGIETIATTFGSSGLEPNTVLMGWAKNTQDPIWFAQMTERLIDLDYNVLYLDYDKRWGFRKREQIDMWWRGISNNAELMLHLARFIGASNEWRNARIRVLLVNDFNVDRRMIEKRIQSLLDEFRVEAEIKVINNAFDRTPFYDLMKTISAEADLIFIGIPNIQPGTEASFVKRTNELVGLIGTTLLVKASSTFETTELGLKELEQKQIFEPGKSQALESLQLPEEQQLSDVVQALDTGLEKAVDQLSEQALAVIQQYYQQWLTDQEVIIRQLLDKAGEEQALTTPLLMAHLDQLRSSSEEYRNQELNALSQLLEEAVAHYGQACEGVFEQLPSRISLKTEQGKSRYVRLRRPLMKWAKRRSKVLLQETLLDFGQLSARFMLANRQLVRKLYKQLEYKSGRALPEVLEEGSVLLTEGFEQLRQQVEGMITKPLVKLRNGDRALCNALAATSGPLALRKWLKQGKQNWGRKTARAAGQDVDAFGRSWDNNQKLFHRNYEVNQQLTHAALLLRSLKTEVTGQLEEVYVGGLRGQIESLRQACGTLQVQLEHGATEALTMAPFQRDEEDLDNTETVLWQFMEQSGRITASLPVEVSLMDQATRRDFRDLQTSEQPPIKLSLLEIADYLVDAQFSNAFQEELIRVRQQLNPLSGQIFNIGSLLHYGVDAAEDAESYEALSVILDKSAIQLKELEQQVKEVFTAFQAEVEEQFQATESALTIDHIIAQAEVLSQYVRKESRRRGIVAWRRRLEESVKAQWDEVRAYAAQKQEDVAQAAVERREQAIRSDRDRLQAFAKVAGPGKEVKARYPFYYRQLFSGKHLNLRTRSESRDAELAKVQEALEDLRQGPGGGILITGEALSGKSYFLEYATRQIFGGSYLKVIPPMGGATSPRALQKAFEQSTGKRGTLDSLLEETSEGTVFLLEDIELWWQRGAGEGQAFGQLLEAIQRYGQRHVFLLSCNLNTLQVLRKQSPINQAMTATVVLRPLSLNQVRGAVWARHKTGGVPLLIEEQPEDKVRQKTWDQLFKRLHRQSEGNIGMALHLWLGHLRVGEGGEQWLETAIHRQDFPVLEDAEWHFVLLQLYLHRALTHRRFSRLFPGKEADWAKVQIAELQRSQLLIFHEREVLELKPEVRFYLGQLFTEKGML